MIEETRIQYLNDNAVNDAGRFVVYWMQQSQREAFNPALEYAARQANALDVPLVAAFGLDANYPDANERHFAFMLEGLAETTEALAKRNVKMIASACSPPEAPVPLATDAALVVCDRGYLRHQRRWRKQLADSIDCRLVQVEGDAVVPVESASGKREWAARTIRKKINGVRDDYLRDLRPTKLNRSSLPLHITADLDLRRWRQVLGELDIDRSVAPAGRFRPGTQTARRRLSRFLRHELPGYADARNDPSSPQASELSPYLHFGQISPVEIAIKVQDATSASDDDKAAFLEELVVRRELAINFVFYADDYDKYACLPDWAQKTLADHRDDDRPHRYTRRELESADTHDRYWNAAMKEMRATGYMHNYMRMYWGKKILEWSNTPEYAYRTALYLNNKYFLDGRDANSYAGVAWLFGLHDQAWAEREIFGKVRYMSAGGLESKFDIDEYVRRVDALAGH